MDIGKSSKVKDDLDSFIVNNPTNAKAYINQAGTSFSYDLEDVAYDCNEAIKLAPNSKKAYFLRGLA